MLTLTQAEKQNITESMEMSMGVRYGTIVNIDDPYGLGRLKVHIPSVEDQAYTDWAFYLRPYSSESSGFWQIPQTGSKVICGFISNIPEQPVILGFIYSQDDLPPIEQDAENNYKMITTPAGSRIQLFDKEGEEAITIVSHDGTMKIEINDTAGILVDNPQGDINLSCKAFTMESPVSGSLNFDKKLIVEAEEDILIESEKALNLKSKKDMLFKTGEDIKLSSAGGVLAKGKPLAAKDDKVIGIDIHKEVVPAGSGTVDVPFPNLFKGKLADKLSSNVFLENRNLATKDSIAKHEAGHTLWPPGIKFCEQPKNEGEVSEGTEPSVLVNGKQAAVLLSKTKNCTDMKLPFIGTGFVLTKGVPMVSVLREILLKVDWGALQDLLAAVGVSLCDVLNMICGLLGTSLENLMNGLLPVSEEIAITQLKWTKEGSEIDYAMVDDEVILQANVQGIKDGEKVKITIFEKDEIGTDDEVAALAGIVSEGKIQAAWKVIYTYDEDDIDSEEEFTENGYTLPEYVFHIKGPALIKEVKSKILSISDWIKIFCIDESTNLPLIGEKYRLYLEDGSIRDGVLDDDGCLHEEKIPPGDFYYEIENHINMNIKNLYEE